MKFGDYSPAASPSFEEQQDALRKGLGRTLQWAMTGLLRDEPLLEACLRDQRFDQQIDDCRADWLWRIIRAVDAGDRFRVPILHALYDLSDEDNANQLCGLARCYAGAGDGTFRNRLYELVERKPFPQMAWLGEEEIIDLDGERAFLFAAGVRGRSLVNRQWDWDDHVIDIAVGRFGKQRVTDLLDTSSDEAVRRFRQSWHEEKERMAKAPRPGSDKSKMKAIPVDEVLQMARGPGAYGWLRGWGRYADESSLHGVFQHLRSEQEPKVIINLLKVFSARALPKFDAGLIDFCRHADDEVRRRAFCALEQNAHPLVREFALAELSKSGKDGLAVGLFINNYQAGDEDQILEYLELPGNECELHWLLMDATKVLEKNPEAESSRLGVIAYATTPCEDCRYSAARLLQQRDSAPEWLMEECRYDSAEKIRKVAGQANGPPPAV